MLNVVCYPNVVVDKRWLKLAALFWDKIFVVGSTQLTEYLSESDDAYLAEIERLSESLGFPMYFALVEEEWTGDMEAESCRWLDDNKDSLMAASEDGRFELVMRDKFFDQAYRKLCSMGLVIHSPGGKRTVQVPIWEDRYHWPVDEPYPEPLREAAYRGPEHLLPDDPNWKPGSPSRKILSEPQARLALAKFLRARRAAARCTDMMTRNLLQKEAQQIYEESLVDVVRQDFGFCEMRPILLASISRGLR